MWCSYRLNHPKEVPGTRSYPQLLPMETLKPCLYYSRCFWPANHQMNASGEIITGSSRIRTPRPPKECVPPKSPGRPPFGGRRMPGVSLLRLFSQCKQASAFLLVNWSRPHRRSPSPPHLPVRPLVPHPSPHYCQSTPNTPSTADRNHVEELLVPIEPRMCLYNSKNWAISPAVGVVFLWLWMYKKQLYGSKTKKRGQKLTESMK